MFCHFEPKGGISKLRTEIFPGKPLTTRLRCYALYSTDVKKGRHNRPFIMYMTHFTLPYQNSKGRPT